ncbi:MAG: mechanosensitive ion channel family protein [Thermoanaerobaculia bacterium]|nr:mechanosensitive ion channel family protein [Thermoanaerobaculia bacterium]
MDTTVVDSLLQYLPEQPWVRNLALLLAFLVLAKLVDWIGSRLLARWTKHTSTDVDDELVAALHRPLFVSVLLLGLWLVLHRVELEELYLTLHERLIKSIAIVVWAVFAWKASRILLTAFSRLEGRHPLIQPRTVPLLDNTLKVLVAGGVVYFFFLTWGINVAAWMAGAGIVGIAVGFAAKDTLANLFAGISLIVDAPYKTGDFIVLDDGQRGMVTKIGLRSTRILTRDDIEITIPNSLIANQRVVNESGGPWPKERLRIDVGVAYGSDVDQVRRLLLEIAAEHEQVVRDPEPRVRFRRLGDSALELQLLCWVDEPVLRGRVIDALLTRIYQRFQQEGVVVPFPQRDLHVKELPDRTV